MKIKLWQFLLLAPLIIVTITYGYYLYVDYLIDGGYQNEGQFGDSFGLLNAMFTGLAFVGLAYTILMQNHQIEEQKKDADSQRKEYLLSRFENNFFQMLQAQRDIVNSIDLIGKYNNKGRDCFKIFYQTHFRDYVTRGAQIKHTHEKIDPNDLENYLTLRELVNIFGGEYFREYQHDLGHYFRHLYYTVSLVDQSEIVKDKAFYIGILRAQLSTYEMLLLFYNGLTGHGEKMKPLINKYGILKGIDHELLINKAADIIDEAGYTASAFK